MREYIWLKFGYSIDLLSSVAIVGSSLLSDVVEVEFVVVVIIVAAVVTVIGSVVAAGLEPEVSGGTTVATGTELWALVSSADPNPLGANSIVPE